jgi:putative membrane-bound dehydrogenase-like protein
MKSVLLPLLLLVPTFLPGQGRPDSPLLKTHPLPEGVTLKDAQGRDNGVRFVDLNGDGHDDLVVSNARSYGVYLFVPKEKEKKNLQWFEGWTQVLREGKAGDAGSIPPIVKADGSDAGVNLNDPALLARLRKVPGPAPKSPQESLAALRLKPGFTATLVASEPLVQDPVYVDWDARGRMWVVEMGDYPFAPGEKTTNGEVGQDKVSALQTGRVKILEDLDGDGVYDKATLFLDGLHHPNGLAFWKGGVFIAANPDILFAEDTDGDGKCDRKEPWFSGFTAGNPQHLVNGFAWGLDGWLYGANGDSGGDIVCVKTGKKVALGANDFRFHPQTGEFEIDAGRTQYGKWRDDWGNWFGNNNSVLGWHYYLPLRYLARNPELAVKSVREVINNDKQVFPASPPVRRFNWASATNTLTSGCCPMPYRDDLFGDDGRNVMFICEPANNLVHRQVLNYEGIAITSSRHPGDKESEFLASEDNWSRPTMARTGPDGALYVVDMYRQVLEHPEWIPAEIVKGLDIRAGEDKGRIYRITKKGQAAAAMPVVAGNLRSPNGWVRDTAMRLIVEQQDKGSAPALEETFRQGTPRSQVQALHTLALLKALKPELVVAALRSPEVEVRLAALRCAEDAPWSPELTTQLVALAADASPRVRYQLALSAGFYPKDPRAQIVAALQKQGDKDSKIVIALKSSTGGAYSSMEVKGQSPALPVITHHNPDRQKVVQAYASAAGLTGNAQRGHLLYTAVCAACHKLKNEGNEIGPDLGTVAGKPVDQIIESILDPNRAVEQRYAVQTVRTKDNQDHVGLILEENSNNITLRTGTSTELILIKNIAQRSSTSRSLMPDGLESVLKPQDLADLMAWIRAGK